MSYMLPSKTLALLQVQSEILVARKCSGSQERVIKPPEAQECGTMKSSCSEFFCTPGSKMT